MIDNLGFLFVVILLSLINLVTLPIFWLLKQKYSCFGRVYQYLKGFIFWNGFIRFALEGYLELTINSLINIEIIIERYKSKGYILNFENMRPIDYYSTLLTFMFSVILFFYPYISIIYLKIYSRDILHQKIHDRPEYEKRSSVCGSFWERLDLRKSSSAYFNFFFVSRRLMLALCLVYMREYVSLQIISIFCQTQI
jgi:hypothetical protein